MVIDNTIKDCDTLLIDSDVYAIYYVVKLRFSWNKLYPKIFK